MNIYLEIFGYFGTALVIISMMMTSLIKLRIFNMSGALVSLIYAVCVNTWPVAVLNACLFCINFVQTVRELRGKEEIVATKAPKGDSAATHFMNVWKADFEKCNPDRNLQAIWRDNAHILYVGEKAIGFLIVGEEGEEDYLLYLSPKHRNKKTQASALALLAQQH